MTEPEEEIELTRDELCHASNAHLRALANGPLPHPDELLQAIKEHYQKWLNGEIDDYREPDLILEIDGKPVAMVNSYV